MNKDARPSGASFPIVGIGASAGGLVALEQFLSNVPLASGMAYVIVQHLDPQREAMLVELLQRHTLMPIVEARDQMRVEPDHVYVIPPGRDLNLRQGLLHLLLPPEPRGLRLPIDCFFKSLADECKQHSIGVVLSGMGSDGSLGLRAIRQAAGACFVQTPASAQFDSMPRSAIDAGVADAVAPADELPSKILDYLAHLRLGVRPESVPGAKGQDIFDKVIAQLHAQTGHDFSLYKKNTISRRIERRMGLHQLSRIADYQHYLQKTPQEAELLCNELLIGVTNFFRDADVWAQLQADVIPALLASQPQGAVLRAWVPGCSSGEEAYSLAMVFKEALLAFNPSARFTLQIFASDLDQAAVATARAGIYPRSIAADVSSQRLNRFFVEDGVGYRVSNEIREMVIFAQQNLIVDPPFTKLDLLSCRNLLIYLEADLQVKLIQLFHYSLNPGGFLLLGSAESIGAATALFEPLPGKSRIYRRLDAPARVPPMGFPPAFMHTHARFAGEAVGLAGGPGPSAPNLQLLVERVLLQHYAPAAVLVSSQGELLYVSGKTGEYLEPASGKASLNVLAMARDGLREVLSETFHRALREQNTGLLKKIRLVGQRPPQHVDVVVQPLQEPVGLQGLVLIVFKDVVLAPRRKTRGAAAGASADGARVESLLQELTQSREEAKSVREEMQTSQEELKSTNEELQSTNEELQSTNEELTTSKEEMQSMNEELRTVNLELQAKVAELSRASNDMKNLLNSTEIATLFLDEALKVRRFTAQTTCIIKLIASDVGRPITDIVTDLNYPELAHDAHEVLRTLMFCEKDVSTRDARWFTVRIMPYRTQENRIDGLVITFMDVSQRKQLATALAAAQARAAALPAATALGGANGLS